MIRQSYINRFLSLRCAGDVLNIASPIQNIAKEISESMSVIKYLKKIALADPMEYALYDLCAGNALTSLIAIHLLPFKYAHAIDKRVRKREWHKVRNFHYVEKDIYHLNPLGFPPKSVIIGVHACTKLAEQIINLYNISNADHLILMPCCIGKTNLNVPDFFRQRLGKYLLWCWHLSQKCVGEVSIKIDNHNMSPQNCLIIARKEVNNNV